MSNLGIMKLAFVVLISLLGPSAWGCSFTPRSAEELFANAKMLFRARVIEARVVSVGIPAFQRSHESVEARYELSEVLISAPPSSGVVREVPFGCGSCSLGLRPSVEYVFFLNEDGVVWGPTGSFALVSDTGGKERAERLAEFRRLASGTK